MNKEDLEKLKIEVQARVNRADDLVEVIVSGALAHRRMGVIPVQHEVTGERAYMLTVEHNGLMMPLTLVSSIEEVGKFVPLGVNGDPSPDDVHHQETTVDALVNAPMNTDLHDAPTTLQ